MQRLKLSKLVFVFLAIGLLVFFVRTYSKFSIQAPQILTDFRVSMFSRISYFGSLLAKLKNINNLAEQNQHLKDENNKLISKLAKMDNLEKENSFLREALNIPRNKDMRITDAGVFNIQFGPEGHTFLINKGSDRGIKENDIVISSSGVLVGIIVDTADNYSKAILTSDANFRVTAKILSKDISGMAQGILGDGISLELISQNDDAREGDTIVTKGNDLFLPGLILGVISKINQNDSSLFREVLVKNPLSDIDLSQVVVVGK